MRVLVACEYSGRVRDAFIARGHEAMSCDILPSDATGPHYQGDVRDVLGDGWDLMIAHPPCTYLTIAAEWAYNDTQKKKIKPGTLIGEARRAAREEAIAFVLTLANAPIERIAIENPIGVLSSRWREPDQFIQPYEYGDDASKKTCLWLKNLPRLSPTVLTPPPPRTLRRLPKLLAAVGQPDGQRAEQGASIRRPLEDPQYHMAWVGRRDGISVG